MSGIMGIYYRDGSPVERENLVKMVDTLAHRGLDGADIWVEDSVGFAHRMLWTTPESLLEKLPLVNRTSDIAITTDCRIDNREELISVLQFKNCPPDKITDSQLILAAYEKWGEQCPEHLLGDFAFAIWDKRQQSVFCARDHFGVKPFYYYLCDSVFVFATEIKAILCLAEVPRQLNEVRIGDYLTSMFEDSTITSYQYIQRLPPAHQMTISQEEIQLKSYWCLDPNRELRLSSDEEYAAKFREIFTEAVRCRLRSAFPIGSMLSGGLDSSSIVCTAKKLLVEKGQKLHTFSAIFDKLTECDERPYINSVIAQGGIEPHYVKGDEISPLRDLERMFWHQDEAFYAPNWSMSWGLYGAIKEQGVRIVLDGFDGDTTVSDGYGYLSELARAGRWLTLTRELRGVTKIFNDSFWVWLWSYISHYGINKTISKYRILRLIRRIWQALKRLGGNNEQSANKAVFLAIANPEFVQQIGLEQRYQASQKLQPHLGLDERERHYRSIITGLSAFALEVMDKQVAAFGTELRYPFWDKRLVEFCLSLPPEQKLGRGWNRVVMRRAMTNILPAKVQWRTGKTDFSANLSHGLLFFEQERLQKLIFNDFGAIEKYVDVTALQEIYQRFLSSKSQEQGMDARLIWIAVSLSLWLSYTVQSRPNELSSKKTKAKV